MVGDRWRSMSDEEKKKYVELADEDERKFKTNKQHKQTNNTNKQHKQTTQTNNTNKQHKHKQTTNTNTNKQTTYNPNKQTTQTTRMEEVTPSQINKLPDQVQEHLRSSVVVYDFAQGVEELIANSLDAGTLLLMLI